MCRQFRKIRLSEMAYPIFSVNDDPKIGESLMGFALRMSEANHLNGLNWLASIFQVSRIRHLSMHHMPAIAWMFGSHPCQFNDATADVHQFKGALQVHAYGQVITRSFLLRLRQPQICPACLEQFQYVRKIWDFSLITCCALHGTTLVETCAGCGRKLNWDRPGIMTCQCGFDLRRTNVVRAHEHARRFAIWLSRRLSVNNETFSEDFSGCQALALLDELSTDGAMRFLWAIGINATAQDVAKAGKARQAPTTAMAEQCIVRGIERFLAIYRRQNWTELRPTFVSSALRTLVIDGVCEADRSIAAQFLTLGKLRENPKASLLHLSPLSQIKLF